MSDSTPKKTRKPSPTKEIKVFDTWCKRCGLCVAFCPKQVYDRDESGKPIPVRLEDCIACRQCELRCPDFAIMVITEDN